AQMERAACRSFLRFLSSFLRPLYVSVQSKAGRIRLRSLLGERCGPFARSCPAATFCFGLSGANRGRSQTFHKTGDRLRAAAAVVASSFERSLQYSGFSAVVGSENFSRQA